MPFVGPVMATEAKADLEVMGEDLAHPEEEDSKMVDSKMEEVWKLEKGININLSNLIN
jgi:hypothetical protein